MSDFVNRCKFYATSTGTGNFVAESAVQGYRLPDDSDAVDTSTYSYVAETLDGLEWEIGTGVYTTSDNTIVRNVLSSSNSDALVNFSTPPVVAFTVLAEDLKTISFPITFSNTVTFNNTASFTVPVEFADGTAALPSITNIGDTDTGLYFPAANELGFSTAGTHAGLIDSSQRIILGHTASVGLGAGSGTLLKLQSHSLTDQGGFGLYRYSNDTGASQLGMFKSRGATLGARAIVQSGDVLGNIIWYGDDGTNAPPAALIRGEVDGTPGALDMPGRLVFLTTADGASTGTERLRISSAGLTSVTGTFSVSSTSTFYDSATIDGGIITTGRYGNSGALVMRRAEGSISIPTVVTGTTTVGNFLARAYDGAAYRDVAGIVFISTGAPVTNLSSPGEISFRTTPVGSVSAAERMKIDSAGVVTIAGNTAWHAGNDGTGSTLDADLLDGLDSTAFVTLAATSTSGFGFVVDEDNMVSDSATKVPTQQSVKAYVDSKDTIGKQEIWIPASAMIPRTTAGAAAFVTELATNDVMINGYDFDTSTVEGVGFFIALPKQWNEGTVTFKGYWTAASGSGTVAWSLQGAARSDDDAMDQAYGTAQTSTDTFIAANDVHVSPESSAITITGTPAAEDLCFFLLTRATGSDTLGVDARLLGIKLYITTDAGTDD